MWQRGGRGGDGGGIKAGHSSRHLFLPSRPQSAFRGLLQLVSTSPCGPILVPEAFLTPRSHGLPLPQDAKCTRDLAASVREGKNIIGALLISAPEEMNEYLPFNELVKTRYLFCHLLMQGQILFGLFQG